MLCKIIWAESRGEDEKGQILVANVILNRVTSKSFPNHLHDVIFQPNAFQPTRDGSFEKAVITEKIKQSVDKVSNDKIDYSQGALYFRTVKGLENSWHQKNLTYLFTHGNHAFFK